MCKEMAVIPEQQLGHFLVFWFSLQQWTHLHF